MKAGFSSRVVNIVYGGHFTGLYAIVYQITAILPDYHVTLLDVLENLISRESAEVHEKSEIKMRV